MQAMFEVMMMPRELSLADADQTDRAAFQQNPVRPWTFDSALEAGLPFMSRRASFLLSDTASCAAHILCSKHLSRRGVTSWQSSRCCIAESAGGWEFAIATGTFWTFLRLLSVTWRRLDSFATTSYSPPLLKYRSIVYESIYSSR
jgi:hypothetical protein